MAIDLSLSPTPIYALSVDVSRLHLCQNLRGLMVKPGHVMTN